MNTPSLTVRPAGDHAALTRRITLLSVGCAALLLGLKSAAWFASGSVALLASLADSGLDLLASLVTFYAVRYAAAPPDAEHRFGHGKAEAFSSLFQAGLVFASAALIAHEAFTRLGAPAPLESGGWAVAVMVVSIAVTGGLIHAQGRVLKAVRSVAVSGDRAHYAADLMSNAAALVGIAGAAYLHLAWLDAAAGLFIAAWLAWGAVSVLRDAADQLLDKELSPEARAGIIAMVGDDPRVLDVHQLRTRAAGPYVHIQMHAALPPQMTLEDAHQVIVEAERRVLALYPTADIIIHADPEGRAEPHGGAFAEREHHEPAAPSSTR